MFSFFFIHSSTSLPACPWLQGQIPVFTPVTHIHTWKLPSLLCWPLSSGGDCSVASEVTKVTTVMPWDYSRHHSGDNKGWEVMLIHSSHLYYPASPGVWISDPHKVTSPAFKGDSFNMLTQSSIVLMKSLSAVQQSNWSLFAWTRARPWWIKHTTMGLWNHWCNRTFLVVSAYAEHQFYVSFCL